MREKTNKLSVFVRVSELVRHGKTASEAYAIVSKEHNISAAAVKKTCQRQGKVHTKIHGNRKMTQEQELIVLYLLVAFSACHVGLSNAKLDEVISDVSGFRPSRKFLFDFRRRHKEAITPRTSKQLSQKRKDGEIVEDVWDFLCAVELRRRMVPMDADRVINVDETRVMMTTHGQVILEKPREKPISVGFPKGCHVGVPSSVRECLRSRSVHVLGCER